MSKSLAESTRKIHEAFQQQLHQLKEKFERKEKPEEESDAEILEDASTIKDGKIDVVGLGVANLQARSNNIKSMVKERKLADSTCYLPASEVNITPAPQPPRKPPDKVICS